MQLKGDKGLSTHLEFSRDGKRLMSLSYHDGARVWDVAARKQLCEVKRDWERFNDALLGPDGGTLLTWRQLAPSEAVIESWDVATGEQRAAVAAAGEYGGLLALSPDGRVLAEAAGPSWEIVFRDAVTGRSLRTVEQGLSLANRIEAVTLSADGKVLAYGDEEGHIHLVDVSTGKSLHGDSTPRGRVGAALFSPDGKTIATAGNDHTVRLWAPDGRELHRLDGWRGFFPKLAFSPDGKHLASTGGYDDPAVRVWDVAGGKLLHRLNTCQGLNTLTFAPDDRSLFAIAWKDERGVEGTLRSGRSWDAVTGKEMPRPSLPPDKYHSRAISADGGRFAYRPDREEPGLVRVWDLVRGANVSAIRDLPDSSSSVALSPDGRTLAWAIDPDERERTGRKDGELRLYEVVSGKERGRSPLASGIFHLRFSPDGRSLAFIRGRSVCVWDVVAGKERGRFEGHTAYIECLAFAPDGKSLVTGSEDSTALVWDLTRLPPVKRPAAVGDVETLWTDLASDDAARAYRAILSLTAAPERAVPLLAKRLASLPTRDALRVGRLIAELDDDAFEVREKAEAALANLGELAEPALRRALGGEPSAEVRQRIERLLAARDSGPPPGLRRAIRALEVLEAVSTPEARRVAEGLTKEGYAPAVVREAEATLRRLDRRAANGR